MFIACDRCDLLATTLYLNYNSLRLGGNGISILGKRSQKSVDIKYDVKRPKSGITHIQLT